MKKQIRIGPKLALPIDVATESIGVLGQRGSGKSNALVVFAEELYDAGVPWFAIDPKGDWWGVRSSSDGKGPGLPVPVFGGLHGDLPLEPTAGAYVADLLVDQMLTAVLDVSRMSMGDLVRFLVDFCHRLFDRHQADPHVRTAIFEEAHRYMPQQITGRDGTARLKEATVKIPLEGRAFGLGSITASQRSSRLHKDVLTQFSILLAMRSPAKLDRDAIGGWVEEHDVSHELLRTLGELESGEAWLWSPHRLHMADRVRVRRRRTFDSGATPQVGRQTRTPRTLADVDLAAIKEAMADTIERAKLDDPKELRARIGELKRLLDESATAAHDDWYRAGFEAAQRQAQPVLGEELVVRLERALSPFAALLSEVQEKLRSEIRENDDVPLSFSGALAAHAQRSSETPKRRAAAQQRSDVRLGEGERRVLTAIAQHRDGVTRKQLQVLTGYRLSTRNTYIRRLAAQHLVDTDGEHVTITDVGLGALGSDFEPLPTGKALRDYWLEELPEGEGHIFSLLCSAYPASVDRERLSELTSFALSTRNTYLRRLAARQLITTQPEPRAADALFQR